MPYTKTTVIAGKTIEIFKHYSARYKPKGMTRQANRKETPEDVKKINQRQAENRLRWKMNTNFGEGDWHIVLTYRRDNRKRLAEAKKDLDLFIRRARRLYRNEGEELKYIAVTESQSSAPHHHLVINGAVDISKLTKLWEWGRPHLTPLDGSGDYGRLASYLIKETSRTFGTAKAVSKLRYTCSRNLKEPIIHREIIGSSRWQEEPRAVKGYYIAGEVERGIHEMTGYPYLHYTMVRLPDIQKKTRLRWRAKRIKE